MKKYIAVAIAIISIISISLSVSFSQENKKDSKIENSNLIKAEIKTSAICDMCKKAIEKAVNKLDGIEKANLNIKTKILSVSFDPNKTSLDNIRKSVSIAGYDADSLLADSKAYRKLPKCCKKDGLHGK
jgi:periplasmic mercuric ion binding protein